MEKYQELSSTVFFLSPVNAGVRAQPGEDFPSLLPAPDREGTAVCGMAETGPTRGEGRGVFLMSPEQGGDTKRQPPSQCGSLCSLQLDLRWVLPLFSFRTSLSFCKLLRDSKELLFM